MKNRVYAVELKLESKLWRIHFRFAGASERQMR